VYHINLHGFVSYMNEWLQDLLLNGILTRVVGGIPLPKPNIRPKGEQLIFPNIP